MFIAVIHRFLQGHLFYPVLFSTALCAILLAGRVVISGERSYGFLVWNLFLAWLPYALAAWLVVIRRGEPGRPWRLILPAALWLAFLPNAPYLVTDFKHLLSPRAFPLYYDIALVFAFAWAGLLLGLTSLYLVQREVAAALGRVTAAAFVVAVAMTTGAGVYIGRFLRWNTWDLWTRPRMIFGTLGDALLNPWDHTHALAHAATFGVVVLLCHLTFLTLRGAERRE